MKGTKGKSNITIHISTNKTVKPKNNFYQFMTQMERMLKENERSIKHEKY